MALLERPLEGLRIVLRELASGDWPDIHAYARLPEACRYQTWGPNSEDESRSYCEQMLAAARQEPRTQYPLAIVPKSSERLIGVAAIAVRSVANRQAELSYIVHPEHWGRGYATEAAQLVVDFAFAELGMHRVYATCDPRNVASSRVLEKLGMAYEGRMRESLLIRDGWRDSLMYSILRQEWPGNKATSQ